MYILLTLIITFSIMFLISQTPLSLGFILIMQTIFISLMFGLNQKSFWFLYLLMLVFIGGMLIMFIYVTSIFPNMKFMLQTNWMMLLSFSLLFFLVLYLINKYFSIFLTFNELNNSLFFMNNQKMISSNKMFLSQNNWMIIFLINYLLYMMIIVIKITNFYKGPIRKMYYE